MSEWLGKTLYKREVELSTTSPYFRARLSVDISATRDSFRSDQVERGAIYPFRWHLSVDPLIQTSGGKKLNIPADCLARIGLVIASLHRY